MTIDKVGPWDAEAFDTLKHWDPQWCAAVDKMASNPWTGVLDRKTWSLSASPSMQRAQILALTEHGGTSGKPSTLAQHATSF